MPEYSPQVCNYNILYNILAGWSRLEGDFFLSCTLYRAVLYTRHNIFLISVERMDFMLRRKILSFRNQNQITLPLYSKLNWDGRSSQCNGYFGKI